MTTHHVEIRTPTGIRLAGFVMTAPFEEVRAEAIKEAAELGGVWSIYTAENRYEEPEASREAAKAEGAQ